MEQNPNTSAASGAKQPQAAQSATPPYYPGAEDFSGPGGGPMGRGGFGGPAWMLKKRGMMIRKNAMITRVLILGSTALLATLILATRDQGGHQHHHYQH